MISQSMQVLITKQISNYHLTLLKSICLKYDVIESLQIIPLQIDTLQESDAWVISSRNSWPVVEKFVKQAPSCIYCIGTWMKSELLKANVESQIHCFDNMKSLAANVSHKNFTRLTYFCGDHHREELSEALDEGFILIKVITHQSKLTYPILKKTYDAIFVFSSRSVESLLKNNTFADKTIFACIGSTTETYLHQQGLTNTFCASVPDSEILVKEFLQRVGKS
jgi:uroporphyrinogen-III synthase